MTRKGNNMRSSRILASTREDDGTLSASFLDTFIVPDDCLPTGYDTLPPFTAKHMPAALDLMADAIGGWADEEADPKADLMPHLAPCPVVVVVVATVVGGRGDPDRDRAPCAVL
jgi:hypothetical protein